jgi:hypothetical protein
MLGMLRESTQAIPALALSPASSRSPKHSGVVVQTSDSPDNLFNIHIHILAPSSTTLLHIPPNLQRRTIQLRLIIQNPEPARFLSDIDMTLHLGNLRSGQLLIDGGRDEGDFARLRVIDHGDRRAAGAAKRAHRNVRECQREKAFGLRPLQVLAAEVGEGGKRRAVQGAADGAVAQGHSVDGFFALVADLAAVAAADDSGGVWHGWEKNGGIGS